MKIWRCDLSRQADVLMEELIKETREVLISGKYTLGHRLTHFEEKFAEYCGVKYAIGVASGTEALYLALMAYGVGEGDEVITSPFTFLGTASAIIMLGAKPVFADIEPGTFNINPLLIESRFTKKTRVIMPVHLYGQMADMDPIIQLANKHGLEITEDAAQAHGSTYRGKKAGNFGCLSCYSFYPSKNLGAYGDAGAVVTDDENLYNKLKLMRNYGQETLYNSVINGINSRLDELQSAYLTIKLKYLNDWNKRRHDLAAQYAKYLPREHVQIPIIANYGTTNYHVYVIRVQQRDELQSYLASKDIQTNIYYPIPLHLLKSHQFLGYRYGDFPEAERASREVLALPMYPEMSEEIPMLVSNEISNFYETFPRT